MRLSTVLGAIVIARNGDRFSFYQDPATYEGSLTRTTALGEAESFALGSQLRSIYLSPSSPSYIHPTHPDLATVAELKALIKTGVEGNVVFDSALALLQGLYPPDTRNRISLANGTVVTAPLGGYQYISVETVEPENDRSLESWTNCPAFEKHTQKFYSSQAFKDKERESQPFFKAVRDFVFGRETSVKNAWNIYDFVNTQLVHNQTYAFRLPPTLIDQARALADWHENGVFSDKDMTGIGNIAGRTMMHHILQALERIAFNHDPLKFMLVETTYQPFISFFHMVDVIDRMPELKAIPDYSSAIALELRRGPAPEFRDFVRVRFRNGTSPDAEWRNIPVFGHEGDMPLTEFIYRTEHAAIGTNHDWRKACGHSSWGWPFESVNLLSLSRVQLPAGITLCDRAKGVIEGILSVLVIIGFWTAWNKRVSKKSKELSFDIATKSDYY